MIIKIEIKEPIKNAWRVREKIEGHLSKLVNSGVIDHVVSGVCFKKSNLFRHERIAKKHLAK
jgi:23S rRNA maturation-related 3'-5' exoribonuclease YhaM